MQWWQLCCCMPVLVILLGLALAYWLNRPPDVGKLKAANDVQGLIEALGYERFRTRRPVGKAAAKALTLMGDSAVEPLIAALDDTSRNLQEHAAWVLGQIGDERAIQPLMTILEDREQKSEVRRTAAAVLGSLGAARAVAPLVRVLQSQHYRQDRGVRPAVATALGQIGDERAIEPPSLRLPYPGLAPRSNKSVLHLLCFYSIKGLAPHAQTSILTLSRTKRGPSTTTSRNTSQWNKTTNSAGPPNSSTAWATSETPPSTRPSGSFCWPFTPTRSLSLRGWPAQRCG